MKRKYLLLLVFLFIVLHSKAQAPGHVPYGEPAPLDLNLANIVFFIVLPIILFVSLIIIRRKKNKKNKKNF